MALPPVLPLVLLGIRVLCWTLRCLKERYRKEKAMGRETDAGMVGKIRPNSILR